VATRVEQAKERLKSIVEESEAIISDPLIGRSEMFRRLKQLRNELADLVQVVSPY